MLDGSPTGYTGWMNYEFFIFDEAFYDAILNTFLIVLSLLLITVFFGFLFARQHETAPKAQPIF